MTRTLARVWRSLAAKLLILLAIFVAVPVVLYGPFRLADEERNTLLLQSVQQQGWLVGRSLRPYLERFQGNDASVLQETIADLGSEGVKVRLLLRPSEAAGSNSFFLVASTDRLDTQAMERELEQLIATDVLHTLEETCEGQQPLATRYVSPDGEVEVLTSITPVNGQRGCWAIVTAHSTSELLSATLGRPYWQLPEVRLAAAIYVLMAVVVITLFLGLWISLRRFASLAEKIRARNVEQGASFAKMNRMPELAGVAEEFDRMVANLEQSAREIRYAAEENAHALKAPLAVISQSVELLRRAVSKDNERGQRALQLVEQSVVRLDALVAAARHMEETVAELMNPPRERLDLSRLLSRLIAPYAVGACGNATVRVVSDLEPGIEILASNDLVDTVVENLLDNAVSFSPPGGEVRIALYRQKQMAILTVEDRGPGVPPEDLERIFERNYSNRPRSASDGELAHPSGIKLPNFGIGLWVVRRNIEAIGGSVRAMNREGGGLRVEVEIPRAE
ncbi:MAG TPA: HAMP domain-containing sensor histidine kinase [Kiloniellales bacterium]|nr:HAMP domain-containing sensor histidine kinase [Kiloniellales bacterium]